MTTGEILGCHDYDQCPLLNSEHRSMLSVLMIRAMSPDCTVVMTLIFEPIEVFMRDTLLLHTAIKCSYFSVMTIKVAMSRL